MANTFNLGNKKWAVKKDQVLAYNSENNNFKPLPFDFSRASTATVVNKSGLIEEVGQDEPRIDFLNDTDGHLLLESSRTNEVNYGDQIVSGGTGSGNNSDLISQTNITNPTGVSQVTLLRENTNSSTHYKQVLGTSVFSAEAIFSVFAKKGTRSRIHIGSTSSFNKRMFVDLENGNILYPPTDSAVDFYGVEDYGNGWYRCYVKIEVGQNSAIFIGGDGSAKSAINNYQGLGTDYYIYLYGAMGEEGDYPTSYIPTNGSSVTRVAETCNNSGNDDVFNDSEGVLYAEISALGESQGVTAITISDSSLSNRVLIALSSGEMRGQFVSSTDNFTKDSTGITIENFNKIACVYTSTTFKVFVNGSQIGTTSTVTTALSGITEIAFDRGDGALDFEGKVKDIRVYNEALTDAELITLTS